MIFFFFHPSELANFLISVLFGLHSKDPASVLCLPSQITYKAIVPIIICVFKPRYQMKAPVKSRKLKIMWIFLVGRKKKLCNKFKLFNFFFHSLCLSILKTQHILWCFVESVFRCFGFVGFSYSVLFTDGRSS